MTDRFRAHRIALADRIGHDAVAVVPAAVEQTRNDDVHHVFRQDSDFHYLTGFAEPDAVCVIAPGHDDGDFHLFVRPRDRETEIWTGFRVGIDGAKERFGADAAFDIGSLEQELPRLMRGRDSLFYRLGNDRLDETVTRVMAAVRAQHERFGVTVPTAVRDIGLVLADLRLRKDPDEIESLRRACRLSADGHMEAMRFTRPGLHEYEVAAAMDFVWRSEGSPRNGYPSIVASGPNAIVLHYIENDRRIEDGDLVLIDAAAEVDMYSSDITRTFPANGSFTAPQRAVYDVVAAAERAGVGAAEPGATLRDVHDASTAVLADGLADLGLVPRSTEEVLSMHLYRTFFMHGTSHWLGLDVHDAGAYRVAGVHRALEPGMAFTVEPGIYVAPDRPEVEFTLLSYDIDAWTERRILQGAAAAREAEEAEKEAAETIVHAIPEEFLGIGVRIEDDILITAEGHENLTGDVPVDPSDVEALCRETSELAGLR